MLPSLLTLTLLLLAILNALLVYSIARPDRRIWPPPAQQTWQYYFVWIPTLLSFLLFIIIGVADWNSLNWPALIRWPIGGLLIVTGKCAGVGRRLAVWTEENFRCGGLAGHNRHVSVLPQSSVCG